jgi:hypothetical protein
VRFNTRPAIAVNILKLHDDGVARRRHLHVTGWPAVVQYNVSEGIRWLLQQQRAAE